MTSPSLDVDSLLRHQADLRGLARRFVADEAGVEDVVQDAWVRALERPPRTGALGGWLRTVAANLARDSHRRSARRRAREEDVARPEAEDATGLRSLERLERQRVVIEAVLGLPDALRVVVHLRYFEDLGPTEIAERTKTSVNTVNDRLLRARDALRVELERELGPEDRTAGLYLLPLAGFAPEVESALRAKLAAGAAAGAAGATALVGGTLMTQKLALACGAVVLGAGIWLFTSNLGSSQREGVPRAAESELAPPPPLEEPSVAAELNDPEPTPAARAAAVTPEERWVVAGEVTEYSGSNIGGADVRLRVWTGGEAEGEPVQDVTVTADDEGLFRCPLTPPTEPSILWATASLEGYWCYGTQSQLQADQDAPRDLQVSMRKLDAVVTGHVRDQHGHPIVGAEVECRSKATTDEEGRYTLGVSSSSSVFMIHATAPGYARQRQNVETVSVGENVVDFVLRPDYRIAGVVRDANGVPVAGATVTTFYGGDALAVESGADGGFEVVGLDPARVQHSLYARKRGYVEGRADVQTGSEPRARQDLVLERGVRLTGRVVDEHGKGLARAALYVGFSPNAYDRLDAVADADGNFEFECIPRGEQWLGTHVESYAPDRRLLDVPSEGSVLAGVEVVLTRGRDVPGLVFDGSEPVPGVRVGARYQGEWTEVSATTDEEGAFELVGLPETEVELSFYKNGHVRRRLELVDHAADDVEMELPRAGRITGQVLDGRSDEPISSFRIRWTQPACPDGTPRLEGMSASWIREGHAYSNAEGTWDTGDEEIDPGFALGLQAIAEGYAPASAPCVVTGTADEPTHVVLRLFPGVRLEGRVIDAATELPVSGAVVRLADGSWISEHEPHGVSWTRTDASGDFVLEDLPEGTARLKVQHAEHGHDVTHTVEVSSTRPPGFQVIELGGGGVVAGIVRADDGTPDANRALFLEGEARGVAGMARFEAHSDATGRFRFNGLPLGRYEIGRVDEGPSALRLAVFVLEKGTQEVVFERPRGDASVELVYAADGEVPDELVAHVILVPEHQTPSPTPVWVVAAEQGRARLTGLPAGEYVARFAALDPGRSTLADARFRVDAGDAETVVVAPKQR